jgi:hypothetical protein
MPEKIANLKGEYLNVFALLISTPSVCPGLCVKPII